MLFFMYLRFQRYHVEKPSDILKVGQEVEAKVVDFNPSEKRDQFKYQGSFR